MRVLIIEDELIIAKDIQLLLQTRKQLESDIAQSAQDAVQMFSSREYELVISDINLEDGPDGISAVIEINQLKKVPVIFLTAYSDQETMDRAAINVPFAYLLKPFNNNQLLLTIDLAIQNFKKASDSTIEIDAGNNALVETLTKREKEILVILASGKIAKEIGDVLNISFRTVEKHKANIKLKLNLNTTGELIHFAMTSRILHLNE